uniref:CLOCK-interacting pacemaker isoform X1 n=1 Tax=Solea senegalensis TaxID=28829 RepID=UPI001CD89B3B|nr:CLOCK-interacting pacemaker isoform X1 [Solea senegalensis]
MSTKRKAESRSRTANRPRIMKSGHSRADSERDSGFSDASSEYMSSMNTTDREDSLHPVGQHGSGPQPSQLAVVGGSYSSMSPMIIMNNVLLKQQPQVVFVQPVVSRQASPAPKETTHRHSQLKKYRPVQKSYPKIAPHPGDWSSSRGTSSSSSSTSSSSSASKRGRSLTSKHREHSHRVKQSRTLGGTVSDSGLNITSPSAPSIMSPLLKSRHSSSMTETSSSSSPASERPSSALSQSEFNTSFSIKQTSDSKNETPSFSQKSNQEKISQGEIDHSDYGDDIRRKRFCNTYNILSNSGLLDITLRTKELLRQNRRTQNDLDQLKEHTDLFLQAIQSGDISICGKLQANLYKEVREKERNRAAQASLKED